MPTPTVPRGRLLLFGLFSFLDLLLTWQLLRDHDGWVYESNLVARWLLDSYGWPALAALKAGSVLVVLGLVAAVSRRRPAAGRWVLTFACSATALVVLYSAVLAGFLESRSAEGLALRVARDEGRRLERQIGSALTYNDLRSAVAEALIAQRCTFSEAISQLLRSDKSRTPNRLAILRTLYPGYSDEECLAANLLEVVLYSLAKNPAHGARLAHSLDVEFQAYYGKSAPRRYGTPWAPSVVEF